jgi:hypothetical protein
VPKESIEGRQTGGEPFLSRVSPTEGCPAPDDTFGTPGAVIARVRGLPGRPERRLDVRPGAFCLDPPLVGAWSLRRLDAAWLLVYLDGIVVHTLQANEYAVLSPLAISRKYFSRTRAVGWTIWPGALPNHPLADFFRCGSPDRGPIEADLSSDPSALWSVHDLGFRAVSPG